MSRRRKSTELLPILAEAFPQTFFPDPQLVQPLKVGIDQDLLAALPTGMTTHEAKSFLFWYTGRPGYKRALLHGRGRIDLTGTVIESEIPDFIREHARERWLELRAARKNTKPANRTGKPATAKPGQPRPAVPLPPLTLEDLYAMAIEATLEITLKFFTLPNAKPAGQGKMAFAVKTPDGQFVAVALPNKAWNKLIKAAQEWPSWIAALSGTMGERTDNGFTLAGPGLQIFEKKPKAPEDTPDVIASAPPPASPPAAESVAPPTPVPPVVVTTKAGAATVTVTKRAPLTLKR